jgi:hypothetical protein
MLKNYNNKKSNNPIIEWAKNLSQPYANGQEAGGRNESPYSPFRKTH